MMESRFVVALFGIGCITTIVVTCVVKGIDGTIVAGGCAAIGTIVGYCFNKMKNKNNNKNGV